MRRHSLITAILAVILGLSLLFSACQSAAAPSAPAKPAEPAKAEAPKPAEQPKAAAPAKPAEPAKAEAPAKPVEKAAAKEPYKVGLLTSIGGPAGTVGVEVRDTAVLELEYINANGGVDGHPLEMVIEDDGTDPTKAATGMTKLTRQDKVLAILGPVYGALDPGSRAVSEREETPHVSHGLMTEELRAKNLKWSFSVLQSEFVQADGIIDVVKDKKYTKVAAIADLSPIYQSVFATLKAKLPKDGVAVVSVEDTFSIKDVDQSAQAIKLKDLIAKEKAQALMIIGSGQAALPLIKAVRQVGIDVPIVGTGGFPFPILLEQGGDAVNGIVFPATKFMAPDKLEDSDPQKAAIANFAKRYQAKYNRPIQPFSTMGPDSLNVVASALKVSGPDKAKLRDAIEKTKNLFGLNGSITYGPGDHEGVAKNSLAVFEIKNKQFTYVRSIK